MKYETIPLFELHDAPVSVERRVEKALKIVRNLFLASTPVVIAYSSGKDSSLVAAITLHAASECEALRHRPIAYRRAASSSPIGLLRGLISWRNLRRSPALQAAVGRVKKPFVIVTSSDTRIENPSISGHLRNDLQRMQAFSKGHGIRCETHLVQPSLLASWQVSILSGRAVPSYAGMKTDCSVSYKITPQVSFRRRRFRDLKAENLIAPVTLLGTRFDESEKRAAAMRFRQDRDDVPVRNKDGEYVMSPIAYFSTDDVWEALAYYGSGVWPSYSDFEDTKRLYADAGGTSCAVVADAIFEGKKAKSGGCGARFGCVICTQTEDKSLAAMVEYDEKYAYARGLVKLNEFVRNIRYDWSRRNWIGRTIKEAFIAIGPDTFSNRTISELSRYLLQLDFDEELRAARAGERPKFELLPLDMLIALDAMQSLYGVARPFQLWADRRDIRERRIRFDVPDTVPVAPQELPETRFLFVGENWDTNHARAQFSGLRDEYREALTERSCAPALTTLKSGHDGWLLETAQAFEVDMEAACFIEDEELDRILEMHDSCVSPGSVTYAYKWYLQYGVITLSHSQQELHDNVCRRTAFKDRLGLTLDFDHSHLMALTVPFKDLPPAARAAWSGKASNGGCQIALGLDDDDVTPGAMLEAVALPFQSLLPNSGRLFAQR